MRNRDFVERAIEKHIFDRFFKHTIYIRFKSDWIHMVYVETGNFVEDTPFIVVEKNAQGKGKVIAVGKDAEQSEAVKQDNCKLFNGFDHPRSCVNDFALAGAVLRNMLAQVMKRRTFVKPIVVLHPLEKTDGGITDLEKRGLLELAESIGSRKTFVWVGRKLTDHELRTLSFVDMSNTQRV